MKTVKARFEMSLWQRIKAACGVWWAIVVTKEIECGDDEGLEIALKPILEGSVKMPTFANELPDTDFFGDLYLDKPENAYRFGWETAILECGEIIAIALEKSE